MWRGLQLEDLPRLSGFPYPVRSIGHTVAESGGTVKCYRHTRTDHVDFCIRYNCKDPFVKDEVAGKSYRVHFPHVAVKMPESHHQYHLNEPCDSIDFSYSLPIMARLHDAGLLPEIPVFEINLSHDLDLMMRELLEYMEHSREYSIADRIDLVCFRMVEEFMFQRRINSEEEDSARRKIRQTASFFQLHFREEMDMEEIAHRNGMSRCTFYRQWARCFDVSPARYLLDLKLEWASVMLRQSRTKVSVLASELHFQNPAYFCALFEHYRSMTPLQYRKAFRDKSENK